MWRCLKLAADRFDVRVNAYVFMTNHIHLLLTPLAAPAISRFMHFSARRYAGYFNERYGRTGSLWEGRFHSSLVADDTYFLACHRYIDLNPVRAGLAARADQYDWSSHRHYALGEKNELVTPHAAIQQLGEEDFRRREAYRALFREAVNPGLLQSIRSSIQSSRPIGVEAKVGRPRKSCLAPFW